MARYSKEAQKKFGNDYTIETHLFRYNSLVPVTYIVQQGDNAWNISQGLGTSLENLQKLNPNVNDFSKLKIGQELIVDQVRFNDEQDPCENECSDN
ncbi:MAG: LysM domain-containing protein [Saprospiraceae bacterium]